MAVFLMTSVLASTGFAVSPSPDEEIRRNFDARTGVNADFELPPSLTQNQALTTLTARIPSVAATFDPTTGVTRSVYNKLGYLTAPQPGSDATAVGLAYVQQNLSLLGISTADFAGYEITDNVFSKVTGATHLYLRQVHGGLPVYNGQLQVHVNREGRILSVNNAFVPGIAQAVAPIAPSLSAQTAVGRAATHLTLDLKQPAQVLRAAQGIAQETTLEASGLSREPIEARLMWLPIRRGDVRLVWNFQTRMPAGDHWFDFNVDAHSGQVWTRLDWIADASYLVFPFPLESPSHAPITPPADGRTLVVDPEDATASPNGWHNDGTTDFTITRGNNVNAYEDSNGSDSPSTPQPDCGAGLDCSFDDPIDFGTQEPATYQDAAVANLFYWSNIVHDVQYHYGFDEAAGNFQVDNFGNGGLGGDPVQTEAQDVGNCNANFGTPPDGSEPTMQMFLCNNVSPARDGDFDAGVIVHEYGHGISNRLVGGPSNVGCLGNSQQPGEGLSDWWSLAYTAEMGDAGTDKRGIGTYLFGQPTDGDGIRPQPYSTDSAINDYTYASMNGLSIPHGVGSVWAQAAWEIYWALVDEHGFDQDIYNVGAGAGNHRAMLYVNEGLKNTICSPAFTDVRDGMIQAATDNFGGEDVCLLWLTFAEFGLGEDAISGGSGSTAPTDGFEAPVECLCDPGETIPIADAGDSQVICEGESILLGTPELPGHTYLWSPGGETTPQITVSPTDNTDYTVTVTTDCGMKSDTTSVFVDNGVGGLTDDFESGTGNWTFDGLWHLATSTTCTAPEDGFTSPVSSMYFGQEGVCTYNTGGTAAGNMDSVPIFGIDGTSTLTFDYFREVESFAGSFDITQVDVLAGGTATNVFFLDSNTPSTLAWTNSGAIDLSAFDGQAIQLRFRFNSGDGVGNDQIGWLVDDVIVTGTSSCAIGPEIFSDGFESEDTSLWSSTVP